MKCFVNRGHPLRAGGVLQGVAVSFCADSSDGHVSAEVVGDFLHVHADLRLPLEPAEGGWWR
jgi:hypothetical protein